MRFKKALFFLGPMVMLLIVASVHAAIANTAPPASPVKVVFIHHSTGGNWLADHTDDQPSGGLGRVLMDNNYFVSATNYGWGPDGIGDRTDIPNWPEWFAGSNSSAILSALYGETGQNIQEYGAWPQLSTDPGGENEIIMIKSCFPNSDLFGDPDDPPASEINEQYTVENAKAVYTRLLTYFATRLDKLFILITPPPQLADAYGSDYQTPAHRAANARAINNWLVNEWLEEYPHDNVAVFDYFNVLTGENNRHQYVNGAMEHVTEGGNNFAYYAADTWDSHPSSEGHRKATDQFVPLLNAYYNQWRNGGTDPTPVDILPSADIKINESDSSVSIDTSQDITVSVALDSGTFSGTTADWWLLHGTPDGTWLTFNLDTLSFSQYSINPFLQMELTTIPSIPVSTLSALEAGTHIFCFAVDRIMNGMLDFEDLYYDYVMVTVTEKGSDPVSSERLQSGDFQYRGAFRLPDAFNWGAQGLSYYPEGNGGAGSLLVTGSQATQDDSGEVCYEESTGCRAYYAEIAIPMPQSAADWEDLPTAEYLREMTAFDGGLVHNLTSYGFVTGIEYVPSQGSQTTDKIYASLNAWYPEGDFGENSFPTIWFNEPDGSNPRGLFHVGPESSPYHGRKMGDYLFSVPQWYADRYLGGRTLVTGRSRGTPVNGEEVSVAGGSQGPTLFAFHPWQTETPSGNLDALPMVYYRSKYPGCAGPDIGVGGTPVECDYPGFTMCDAWTGADFVESGSKNAILISGLKGSTNCYYCTESTDDPQCHQNPLPGECDLFCNEDRGYHCGPYERQVIFYDPEDVGQAAMGTTDPWSVLPYAVWRPAEFYLMDAQGYTCADVGGMAADNIGGRLFIIERGLGGYQNENAAVIHVWAL